MKMGSSINTSRLNLFFNNYGGSYEDDSKKIETKTEWETINSMIPMWKKSKSELSDEDYNKFYKDMFYDYEDPFMHLHYSVEGLVDYKALLYIPKKCPEAYFSKYSSACSRFNSKFT